MQREGNNDAEGALATGNGVGFAILPRNYREASMVIMARSVCRALTRWKGIGGISPRGLQPPRTPFICLVGGWGLVKREPDSRAAAGDDVDSVPTPTPSAFLSG